jgi:tellurite resistance protein
MGIAESLSSMADELAVKELIAQREMAAQQAAQDQQAAKVEREIVLGALTESAYIVAAADGALSDAERSELGRGLAAITQASEDELAEMVDRVAPAVVEQGPKARLAEIAEVISDAELREAAYLVACAVAWRDGGIGEKQGLALRGLKDAFGYSEGKHQALLAKARQLM